MEQSGVGGTKSTPSLPCAKMLTPHKRLTNISCVGFFFLLILNPVLEFTKHCVITPNFVQHHGDALDAFRDNKAA